jgi:hypothetical protein
MKPHAVFLTNKIYIDKSLNEGGVRMCTEDYINLLSTKFELLIFPVENRKSILYRVLVKLGISQYRDFKSPSKINELHRLLIQKNVEFLFLNQSNTAFFGIEVKKLVGRNLKVFICSHGNESGDLLHFMTRFRASIPWYRHFFSSWTLGRTILTEAKHRAGGINGVFTVSEVETQIENWLGAKRVLFVPRTITNQFQFYNNRLGIVGFIGDLSHAPNYFGLKSLCDAINETGDYNNIQLRIVGSSFDIGTILEKEYSFVSYLGYLKNEDVLIECESWSFFVNPVFYYSRGVTTKLGKALGLGIPVITTEIGCRGYHWERGVLPIVQTPVQMASAILQLSSDIEKINYYRSQVVEIVNSSPTYENLSDRLINFVS